MPTVDSVDWANSDFNQTIDKIDNIDLHENNISYQVMVFIENGRIKAKKKIK